MENNALPGSAPPIERRLATILMADVADYSRMMGEDEERTVQVFRGHRQIFDELLRLHRGRIFNTAGDAVLAEFPSAVEAVRCATEIQAALHTRNEHLPADQRMWFRIGINLGDVIVQGGDLLGDGVNVAARIQSIAEPGGICISGSVYDQIQNKLTLQFRQLGEQSFKNIAQPIRTFSISGSDSAALPSVAPRRRYASKGVLAAGAIAAIVVALGGGYAMYRARDAAVADEARRAAEARAAAEAQRSAEQERKAEELRKAEQERKLQQERVAAEAAQREAKLQAELKASRDALQQAALSKKADEERKAAEATRRAAEAAAQKASEEQAKAAAAAAAQKAASPPAVAAAAPSKAAGAPTAAVDRFDGIYNGRMCNMFVQPEPKTVCWSPPLKVERGTLLSTWISSNTGKPSYARGKISPQGNVEITLEGFSPKGAPVLGLMTGTWSDNEISVSGVWPGGLRVNGRWTRAP